ncbi:MAG: hypothetical protein WED00_05760 [Aquisalimonadaceae bacterium]
MRVHILMGVMVLIGVLAGCASTPEPESMPEPEPPLVICDVDPALTESEPEPERPAADDDYTQRDVGLYIIALHKWATRGWARVMTIRERSEDCVRRANL